MSNQLTLSQRLKNAREQGGKTEVEAMTMAQLSKERVTFGAKYVNYTYQHMWDNHPDWIQFMVDRYASSEKKDHQKLMRYVSLKLECVENAQDQMPVMPKGKPVSRVVGTTGKVQGYASDQGKGQGVFDFSGISRRTSLRNAYQRPVGGGLRGHRCSTRDVLPGDYAGQCDSAECRGDAVQDHPHRAGSPAGHPTSGEPHAPQPGRSSRGPELVREDNLTDPCLSASHETNRVHSIIQQITQELQRVLSRTKPIGKAYTLAEVFCSSRSPLTQQVNALGQKAIRFGYDQGDLATVEGRVALFTQIAVHRPEHVWFSPTCGPWSSWTNLNMSRSLEHFYEYQQQREQLLYQIALGIVLCRHQISHGRHMHWEQPGRSLMLRLPCMQEIHSYTQACQFDMCRAGNLVDPVSQHAHSQEHGVTDHLQENVSSISWPDLSRKS